MSCKLSSADLVTETDKKVEQMIMESLNKKFPSHKYDMTNCGRGYIFEGPLYCIIDTIIITRFIGEESANGACVLTDDPTWIVDPIDGTCNFVHG